jgi:hypothetical protein
VHWPTLIATARAAIVDFQTCLAKASGVNTHIFWSDIYSPSLSWYNKPPQLAFELSGVGTFCAFTAIELIRN